MAKSQHPTLPGPTDFITFTRRLITDSQLTGKTSAAQHYSAALNSLIRYRGDSVLHISHITPQFIKLYENHLRQQGLCPNTTSYYMRKLRAIYNQAVEQGLTTQRNPFSHVYTGIAKTTKRPVSINLIRTLRNLDLRHTPTTQLARDIFLFSFYTRGMSFVDICNLTQHNLKNGILTYRRQKTHRQLSIRWEQPMQDIVNLHHIKGSPYLLPMIKDNSKDPRRQYLSASHLITRHLRKLGEQLQLTSPLTLYRARHAWASIARDNNIPISIISEAMGHDSEKTTRIYLDTLDTGLIDQANLTILNLLTP